MAIGSSAAFAGTLTSFGTGTGNLNAYVFGSSGISDANMEVSTAGNVKIGLKAHARYAGELANDGVSTYYAAPGTTTGPAPLFTVGSTWNYTFAIDTGSVPISNYTVKLLVDFDPSPATSFVEADYSSVFNVSAPAATKVGDSQNLNFNFWSALPGYQPFNPWAPGKYDLMLSVTPLSESSSSVTSSISVVVVPLPAAAWAGLALLGAVGVRRGVRAKLGL